MTTENKLIFETLFRFATEGILIADADGVILKANPALNKMFGYASGLEGITIEALIPDNLRDAHRDHRTGYQKSPKVRAMGQNIDLYGQRKDGTIFPVEVSLSPSKIEADEVVIAFVIDISERKKREQVELSMGRLFDQSLNEIYIFNYNDLRFLRVNHAAIGNLGYTMKELKDMTPVDIKPEFNSEAFETMIKPLRDDTPKVQFETLHQRKDGSSYPIEVHLQRTIFNMEPAFIAIILDITERKIAENNLRKYSIDLEKKVEERTRELRESQKLHSAIARNFPDGMISIFDKDLRYVFVEGKELFALGITSEMLIGTPYLDRLAPEIAAQTAKELTEVFKGQPSSIDIKYRDNDYVLDAVPIADDNGEIKHILVIEKNITERKKAEDQVRRALEHERELGELKSRFVSTASHEFRTPLSTILSSVSLLSKYQSVGDQEKRDKHIQRIKSAVHNLTSILNDFLSLDKLETGVIQGNPVQFDLPLFIQDICDQLGPTLRKNQRIKYQHTGNNEVNLDKHILNNILLNLLSNASKYSGENSAIELSTTVKNGSMQLKVKDYGSGLSEDDQKHLFERFFRSKSAINIPGTGLGLNIVKKYVDLLGGDIDVYSVFGEGSTFTIVLNQS